MKLNIKTNLILSFFITVSAIAMSGNVDIWTNLTDRSVSYLDNSYPEGVLRIQGEQKKIGSRLEKNIKLKVEVIKFVGSRAEATNFTADIKNGELLPKKFSVYKADENFNRVGSRAEGELELDSANKQEIEGLFLGNQFSAETVRN